LAHDGPSGLAEARHFQPAIAFCDIGLPGMAGYAFARAFREDAALSQIYVVALSGYARSEDIERARATRFDQHLANLVGLEELNKVRVGPAHWLAASGDRTALG
jgi:CheY-like chemotaxis protein